jgi:formate dehydrogenase subunit gamma
VSNGQAIHSRIDHAYITRYTFAERLCHWLTGLTYVYCLATGLALYTPYLFWIAIALGGGPASRFWHPIIGVIFTVALIWMHTMWRREMPLAEVDREWLGKSKEYTTNHDEALPPQGRFNAGQKLFYWAMVYGVVFLLLSGIVMWLPEYVPFSVGWVRALAILIHEAAALITIGAFIIHVYMGLLMVPGSASAMIHGNVPVEWARHHHRLWYDQVTREE